MVKYRLLICLIIALILITTAVPKTLTKGTYTARIYDKEWLDVNRWRCPFYNDGRFGIDVGTRRDVAGGYWPYPLRNFYIFGAGLWVGALRPRLDEPGRFDTLVTVGYNPNSGATENVPTLSQYQEQGYGNAYDRIYKYPGSWDIDREEFKERFIPDSTYLELGLVPTASFSSGDMWMCFSDADPEMHSEPGKPLGIDMYLKVYAWNYPSNRDIFFMLYKVKNVSGDTLKNMILGVVMDADIGEAPDDMVGLIKDKLFLDGTPDSFRVRDVGYNYDNDGQETPHAQWQSGRPGAIAYKFLESPRSGPGDTTRLGMTAFKKFTIEIDPVKDPDQYLTLAGYDYRTRIKTPFDSVDLTEADKRFIQCSGPFILPPDSVTNITVAVIAAEYPGSGGTPPTIWDTLQLARVAAEAQFIYDQGWLLPEPPPNPNIRLIPGDKKVTITWDNSSELVPDKFYPVAQTPDTTSPSYNPDYKQFDFEGYKLYRSEDNGVSWALLTQCDVVNGTEFEDTLTAESIRTVANDTGLFYSYVDERVANGFIYYYAVNAYDYNFLRYRDSLGGVSIEPFSLESGLKSSEVIPRSEPVNVKPPPELVVNQVIPEDTTLKIGVNILADIVEPALVTGKKYYIRFMEPTPEYITWIEVVTVPQTGKDSLILRSGVQPKYRYSVISDSAEILDTVIRNSGYLYNIQTAAKKIYGAPVFDGLKLTHEIKMERPPTFLDSAAVIAGNYPVESIAFTHQPYPVVWSFRGADFKIVWQGRAPDSLTVEVTDLQTNTIIPYTNYRYNNRENDSVINIQRGNGWNFSKPSYSTEPSPILRASDVYLYICGQPVNLNKQITRSVGTLIDLIQPGDIWEVYSPEGYARAPTGCLFELLTEGAELVFRSDTTYKLNVIVTPNPYLVTNRWEQNKYERQIAFSRLPAECTIRIFSLAGDLVRVIEHKESSERRTDPVNPVTNDLGGTEVWNLLNQSEALVASGVYIFYVESKVGKQVGKFAIIH
jgi:hypothetical protein